MDVDDWMDGFEHGGVANIRPVPSFRYDLFHTPTLVRAFGRSIRLSLAFA